MMITMSILKMRTPSSNHISLDNSRSSSRMQISRLVTRIAKNLESFSLSPKTKARENSRMLVKATMFLLGQKATDVKDLDT